MDAKSDPNKYLNTFSNNFNCLNDQMYFEKIKFNDFVSTFHSDLEEFDPDYAYIGNDYI